MIKKLFILLLILTIFFIPLNTHADSEIKGFEKNYELPIAKNPCPIEGSTKRTYIKSLIKQLNEENPGVRKRLFHAIKDGNLEGWTN